MRDVDRGVLATAGELFGSRHYPGVVALVTDALEDEPECVPLILLRARSYIGLRRDLEAQADLRDIIRLDPQCGLAYRLLGELAARRDQNESAAIFFREALRLDPADREAADWLAIVEASVRPAAVAKKLPAPAAAAGRFPSSPARFPRAETQPRFAKGTFAPEDERPTHRQGAAIQSAPVAQPIRRPPSQPTIRTTTPELPGFGDYLVQTGILTRERLRAAQAYQRSMKVQLSTAIVTLGLATPQRIEWAAVAHQSQLGRER
jgi:tetratricopeptide (TPR) repeat protein